MQDDNDDEDWESIRDSQMIAPASTQIPPNPHLQRSQLTVPVVPQAVPNPIGTIAD